MPNVDEILRGLSTIAGRFVLLAIVWHAALGIVLVAVAQGYRPSRRAACFAFATPLLSVSTLAWLSGNPFNGAVFSGLFVLLVVIAARLPNEALQRPPAWAWIAGGATLGYAWLYPHFLQSSSVALYLIGAPMGLLPCPTLSMVIGLGLFAQGLGSRGFVLSIAGAGLFYGLFGILKLGVWLDGGLLLAACTLLVGFGRPQRG